MTADSQTIRGLVPPRLRAWVAGILISVQILGQSKAAWMKTANYNDLAIRQQHFDLGLSYSGTVVHLVWRGGVFRGSGVVVNNRRCIAMAAHEFENAGLFLDPNTEEFFIRTGPNHINNSGTSVRISQVIRHPSRTAPGVGTDSAIAILESNLPGAIPATIATIQPAVNAGLDMIGFGNQGTASVSSWGYIVPTSGDIIGGKAPVYAIDSGLIQTRFMANSPQPLIFGGTPGDSGGGLFNSQRQLCGTLSSIGTPTSNCNTYSVNLLTISTWIQEVTASYNSIPDLLIAPAGTAMRLTWDAAATGYWLQTSDELSTWTNLGSVLTGPGTYDDPIASRPRQFYRLFKP